MGPVLPWPSSFALASASEDDRLRLPGYLFAEQAGAGYGERELALRVDPLGSEPWWGCFRAADEPGVLDATAVGFPDGHSFVVVQGGVALHVTARAPEIACVLEHCLPVVHLLVVRERGLLVLGGPDTLAAYGAHGLAWTSTGLCRGELELLGVDDGAIVCRAVADRDEGTALLHVDLASGRARAGN